MSKGKCGLRRGYDLWKMGLGEVVFERITLELKGIIAFLVDYVNSLNIFFVIIHRNIVSVLLMRTSAPFYFKLHPH